VTVCGFDRSPIQDEGNQQQAEPTRKACVAELKRLDEHASQCRMC